MNHNQRQTKIDFFCQSSFLLFSRYKKFFYFFLGSIRLEIFFAAHKMHGNIKKVLCPHICVSSAGHRNPLSLYFIFFGMCVACNFFCLIIFAVLMMTGYALLSYIRYKTLKAVVNEERWCHQPSGT